MVWLRLIRWKNLLIIMLTQLVVWLCAVRPVGFVDSSLLTMNWLMFFLLSGSTVLIAAGGYIINDYFDVRIDAINRPHKVILSTDINRRRAIVLHICVNAAAFLMAIIVANAVSNLRLLLFHLFWAIMLWFYSTHLKQMFVWGNVSVAVMTALSVVIIAAFEPGLYGLYSQGAILHSSNDRIVFNPLHVIALFTFFAFFTTWMREIIKDMEDLKGDLAEGCKTMPIKWGLLRSSRFVQMLGIVVMPALIFTLGYLLFNSYFITAALVIVLIAILVQLILKIPAAATETHYSKWSRLMKIIMVIGISGLAALWLETTFKQNFF